MRRREGVEGIDTPLIGPRDPWFRFDSHTLGSMTKRGFDVSVAALLLVVLTPILVVVVIGIKLDSRGPLLYRSRRIGRHGPEFVMLKFRKMRDNVAGIALTSVGDERFTRVGKILSSTKLDELPQLWNVIRGDMSLVGPRPEDPSFVGVYPDLFTDVLRVRPGITGLSQLAFAKESRVLEGPDPERRYIEALLPQKIAIDRLYAGVRSMRMDLRILAWTVIAVALNVNVSVDRKNGRLSRRRRELGPIAAANGHLASEKSSS